MDSIPSKRTSSEGSVNESDVVKKLKAQLEKAHRENKELLATNKAVQLENKKLSEFKKTGVEQLYQKPLPLVVSARYKGIPSQLPTPSVYSKFHSAATFIVEDFKILEADKKVSPLCPAKSSQLLAKIRDEFNNVTAANENEVQDLVKCLLEDIIVAQGWSDIVIRKEVRLVNFRPDILVVSEPNGNVLGFVEVKMFTRNPSNTRKLRPEPGKPSDLGGQLYDYLKTVYNFGVARPFGMLHTYDTCRVVWCQHVDTEEDTSDGNGCDALSTSPLTNLTPPSSPPPPVPFLGLSLPPLGETSGNDTDEVTESVHEDKSCNDRVFQSSIVFYTPKEVLHATTAALRLMRKAKVNINRVAVPQQGAKISMESLKILSKKGMTYSTKNVSFHMDFTAMLNELKNDLYLVREIGRGVSAICFVAADEKGRAAALKTYFMKVDQTREDFCGETRRLAETEAEIWNKVYGKGTAEVFYFKATEAYAGALLMPYCCPLRLEQRKNCKEHVIRAFEHLADKGYRYQKEDLRWRHVGARGKGKDLKIVLLDFGNLEEVIFKTPEEKRDFAEKQWNELEARLASENLNGEGHCM